MKTIDNRFGMIRAVVGNHTATSQCRELGEHNPTLVKIRFRMDQFQSLLSARFRSVNYKESSAPHLQNQSSKIDSVCKVHASTCEERDSQFG